MIKNSEELHLVKLENPVKQYAWGRTSKDCFVSRLSGKENYKHYAELWMGVHCNGQSLVKTNQNPIKLSQYLRKNAYNSIQFLYKVLSIEKCLSLQVHPNKQQAIKWNSQRPHIYADNNDKPQMFYTLDEFQCFFGYVSAEQFLRICGIEAFKQFFQLKQVKTPKDMIIQILKLGQKQQQQLLVECLSILQKIHPTRYNADTKNRKIWRIHEDFPNDIGVVVTFFLTYKIIPRGVCYYIESNMPHAYIYGQCLQIMKNSDNVCRLGLTPKLKDLEVMDEALGDYFGSNSPVEPLKSFGSSNRVISESFIKQGLQLLIITFKQKSKKDYPNQGGSLKQKLIGNKRTRICLIVEGIYRIREQGDLDKEQILKVGDVVIIKEDKQYTIERVEEEENGRGLVCLGWSSF